MSPFSDIGDWKMSITENNHHKQERTSTFVIESINESPIGDLTPEKKQGPLAGLLVRNKYKGIIKIFHFDK